MGEIPLMAPAMPIVSPGLPHGLPFNDTPPETVRSASVKSHGSMLPSDQPARANTPIVSDTCCSRLMLTPGRLVLGRTALMSAGCPVSWVSSTASRRRYRQRLVGGDAGREPCALRCGEGRRKRHGAGGGNPVPSLGRGLLHHRRYPACGRRRPRPTGVAGRSKLI